MDQRVAKRLRDAQIACERIQQYSAGRTYQDYLEDDYFRSVVERPFEVLSEALKVAEGIDSSLSARFPELSQIVGLRNRIAHDYDELDEKTVWETVALDVPTLLPRLQLLLESLEAPADFCD